MDNTKKFPVAIYGAGATANSMFGYLKNKYNIVCFCDSDIKKQGGKFLNLPVYSYEEALSKYEGLKIYIATQMEYKFRIMDDLINKGIDKTVILNYEPYKKYKSCTQLESRIGLSEKAMLICPSSFGRNTTPIIEYTGDYIKDIEKFKTVRDSIIKEVSTEKKAEYVHNCNTCPYAKEGYWPERRRITDICFSIKHKCNFNCTYCVENKLDKTKYEGNEHLDEVLALIQEMRNNGDIDETAVICIAPTEISIHPYKEKMLDATNELICQFTTNAGVYVDKIASSLEKGGKIFCSLDAGTRETFKIVKGIDCYQKVVENLKKYAAHGVVEIKYIFLVDCNDNEKDIEGFIEACVHINPTSIHIARDTNEFAKRLPNRTMDMIAYMINMAKEKEIWVNFSPLAFSKEEYSYISNKIKDGKEGKKL